MVGRSTRARRKPQTMYDTAALGTKEQQAQAAEENEREGMDEELDDEEELEGEGEEEEEPDKRIKAPIPAAAGRRGSGRARRASASPALPSRKNAALGVTETPTRGPNKKAARSGRKSTGGVSLRGSGGASTDQYEAEEEDAEEEGLLFDEGGVGGRGGEGNGLFQAVKTSNAALSAVVADWVSSYEQDRMAAMEELLNFVLLACGAPCTDGPYAPPEGVDVTDMEAEQWTALMQEVTEDMRSVSQAGTGWIFPLAPAAKGKAGKGSRAFRANFCEVFQRMTEACRRATGLDTAALLSVSDSLIALSQQESADVRLAATLAGMEVGLGVAEGLGELHVKLAVGQRQLEGATAKAGNKAVSRKAKGLASQVERLSNAIAGLTEVSDLVYSRITQKRYRDVSPVVRTTVLDGLGRIMLCLPEIYVQDKLMRYLGWSLSDKTPAVRSVALQAIERLLKDENSCARLAKFCGHFSKRVKAMLNDGDGGICREAAVVLRLMLSSGFLEGLEREDEVEIESAIFEQDLPLLARAECMAFFVDRLEEFVETDAEKAAAEGGGGGQKGKGAKAKGKKGTGGNANEDEEQISAVRLEALAQLINMHATLGATTAIENGEEGGEGDDAAAEAVVDAERLACADSAVQALWCLPQAAVVRRWRVLCKLLANEEVAVTASDRGGESGALDSGEQTVVARILLSAAKMATSEAATGRRKFGGQILGKDAKQELRGSVSELTEACLTHLPNLLAKFQADDAKLALLSELPRYLPNEELASLVSGTGKEAFSDLLSRTKDAFLTSNSSLVMDASAASLRSFLGADHAKRAEVEAAVQAVTEELAAKTCTLCRKDEEDQTTPGDHEGAASGGKRNRNAKKGLIGKDTRAWKDTGSALACHLRRLRSLAGCVDPSARVGPGAISELWKAVKEAVERRCLLGNVLPPKTPPSQYDERLHIAREVVEEGCHVLYTLFLWQISPLFNRLRISGAALQPAADAEDLEDGVSDVGDGEESSPAKKKPRRGGRRNKEDAAEHLGDSPEDADQITEETTQRVVEYRDGLVEVLRSMLSMHLSPRLADEDGEGEGGEKGENDVPRVLTIKQKNLLVGPARRAAWMASNELQTILKAFFMGVEGAFSSLAWQPDKPFTRLLQEHFEAQEDAMIASALVADQNRKKRGSKNKKSKKDDLLKEEKGEEEQDSSEDQGENDEGDDDQGGASLEGLDAWKEKQEEERGANDLLLPLMKSIYSNADRLNRRQAAAVVAHLVHSSGPAGSLAKCFISKLKEHSPVRCLEVHMATLRVFYDKWVTSPVAGGGDEDADGSDEETRRSAGDRAGLDRWLPLAHRLSTSLGIGPLRSKDPAEQRTLQDMFLRFMKEGVRFALDPEGDRLLFLEGVREYAGKVTPRQKKILGNFFDEEAKGLHDLVLDEGREYASLWDAGDTEAVPTRWKAFFSLRNALSPGDAVSFVPEGSGGYASPGDASSLSPSNSADTPASGASRASSSSINSMNSAGRIGLVSHGSGKRKRASMASTVRSIKSRMSTASDLFPVIEEQQMQEEEEDKDDGGDDTNSIDNGSSNVGTGEQGDGKVEGDFAGDGGDGDGGDGNDGNDDGGDVDEDARGVRRAVSEVGTPNKRRLGDVERLEETERENADDLLEDLALNPSDADAVPLKSTSNKKARR